jgi:hypothetical protein
MMNVILLLFLPLAAVAQEATITIDINRVAGQAGVNEVCLEDYAEPYSYDHRDNYEPVPEAVSTDGSSISCTFKPHSFTQIVVKVTD